MSAVELIVAWTDELPVIQAARNNSLLKADTD